VKTYNCRVITPMFAHGADSSKFELRATEIKGAMRFWFRTALGTKLKKNVKALKIIESYIFGDTSRKSKVMLSVECPSNANSKGLRSNLSISVKLGKNKTINMDPIKYLSYGMYDSPKSSEWHEYLKNGAFKINVSFFLNRDDKEESEDLTFLVDNLIHIMSLFGGIGAKTTRGFGIFSVNEFPFEYDKDIRKVTAKIVENIYKASKKIFEKKYEKDEFRPVEFDSIPLYPIIDLGKKDSMGVLQLHEKNPVNALAEVGKSYYLFRRILEPDGSFHNSYNTGKAYKAKRAMLGLPINYQTPRPSLTLNNEFGRKSSPLKLTVHKGEDAYYLVYIFLPSALGKNGVLDVLKDKIAISNVKVSDDFDNLYETFKNTVTEGKR